MGDYILQKYKFLLHENNNNLAIFSALYVNCLYTLRLKSLGSVRLLIFFKEVSYALQDCIYLIKNTEIKQ